jgi:hypothetical protein
MTLWYPTGGNGVFITLLALSLVVLVAQLPHECEAQCVVALVDSLATSASQPALQVPSLAIKLKVLGSTSVTVTNVELFMNSASTALPHPHPSTHSPPSPQALTGVSVLALAAP